MLPSLGVRSSKWTTSSAGKKVLRAPQIDSKKRRMAKALARVRSKINPSSKVYYSATCDTDAYAKIGKAESVSPAPGDLLSGHYRVIHNVDDVRFVRVLNKSETSQKEIATSASTQSSTTSCGGSTESDQKSTRTSNTSLGSSQSGEQKVISRLERKLRITSKQRDVLLAHSLNQEELLTDTRKELESTRGQLDIALSSAAHQQEIIDQLRGQPQESSVQIHNRDATIRELQKEVDTTSYTLQVEKNGSEALRNTVKDNVAQLEQHAVQVSKLEKDLESTKDSFLAERVTREALQGDIKEKGLELEQQSRGIRDLESHLQGSHKLLLQSQAECAQLRADLEEKDTTLEAKEVELGTLYKHQELLVQSCQHSKKVAKDSEDEANDRASKIDELQAQLADKDKDIAEPKAAKKSEMDADSLAKKAKELEGQLGSKEEELSEVKAKDTAFRKERQRLLKERGAFKKQAKAVADELDKSKGLILYKETEIREIHQRDKRIVEKLVEERDELAALVREFNAFLAQNGDEFESALATRAANLEKEVADLRKEVLYRTYDVQNILVQMQGQENLWKEINQKNEELRQERRDAVDKFVTLQVKHDRSEAMIMEIKKAFSIDLDAFNNDDPDSVDFIVSAKGPDKDKAKQIVAAHIDAKYALKARLTGQIIELKSEYADLLTKFNETDNELVGKVLAEAEMLQRVSSLEKTVENQTAIIETQKEQISRFNNVFQHNALGNGPFGCPLALYREMEGKLRPMEDEVIRLRGLMVPLETAYENLQDEFRKETRRLKIEKENAEAEGVKFMNLYYDEAVMETGRLQRELAKYKKRAGEPVEVPRSYPFNKLVHERKFMAHLYRHKMTNDPNKLPPFLREWDPSFTAAKHGATVLAMKKIMPDLWYVHQQLGKIWIPPTVPILTEMGVLDQFGADGDAMVARIKAIYEELQQLNSQIPGYSDSEDDSDDEPEIGDRSHQQEERNYLEGVPTMSADVESPSGTQDTNEGGRPSWAQLFAERSARVDADHAQALAAKRAFDNGIVDIP